MTASTEMSKAIRETLEKHGPTLSDVPTDTLGEFEIILAAYCRDIHGEMVLRGIDLTNASWLWLPKEA